jgi:hypothetical protein
MLHLTKLAVGVRDIDQLREWQAERAVRNPPLRHRTRSFPRRHHEVIDGGSMYWVINGCMLVRQRIVDIIEDRREDGRACAGLVLDGALVQVAGRPTKPFQGWRYLQPDAAPPDLAAAPSARGEEALPPALRRELRMLCLL